MSVYLILICWLLDFKNIIVAVFALFSVISATGIYLQIVGI